jgi:hypothetical protein
MMHDNALQRGKLIVDAKKGDAEVGADPRQGGARGREYPPRLGLGGYGYPERANQAYRGDRQDAHEPGRGAHDLASAFQKRVAAMAGAHHAGRRPAGSSNLGENRKLDKENRIMTKHIDRLMSRRQ